MTRRASHYPISLLVLDIFRNSGTKPSAFIHSIGYRNLNGGFRSLDEWLQSGSGNPEFLRRLVEAYGHAEELRNALMETAEVKRYEAELAAQETERRERANFKPYIFVESSLRTPTFIAAAALTGCSMKFIWLPEDCLGISELDLLMNVQRVVREHYRENTGQCLLFGEITGYRFVHTYDASIRLAIDGNVISREIGHFKIPLSVGVQIGGKYIKTTEAGPAILPGSEWKTSKA